MRLDHHGRAISRAQRVDRHLQAAFILREQVQAPVRLCEHKIPRCGNPRLRLGGEAELSARLPGTCQALDHLRLLMCCTLPSLPMSDSLRPTEATRADANAVPTA